MPSIVFSLQHLAEEQLVALANLASYPLTVPVQAFQRCYRYGPTRAPPRTPMRRGPKGVPEIRVPRKAAISQLPRPSMPPAWSQWIHIVNSGMNRPSDITPASHAVKASF
jgi:hypothetical protein